MNLLAANPGRFKSYLSQLGYKISEYGVAAAFLNLESGYSHCETASYLALATLALDAKDAGLDVRKFMHMAGHARAMVDVLSEFKTAGLMREELFKNDARALLGVAIPDKGQADWISRVLTDPVVAKDRVATSRINYSKMMG